MLTAWNPKSVLIVGGVVAVAAWYLKSRAVETVKAAGQAVNPLNHENVFNRGAQATWDVFTDGEGTIGTDIYDGAASLGKYYKYTPLGIYDALTDGAMW